jgi:hypothetical protein
MSAIVMWKRLTVNDFNAMNGKASPHGDGGGARHIALGVQNASFPIGRFLNSGRRSSVTIATSAQTGNHDQGALIFNSNPSRRGGEWLIRDQFSHRHPAWSPAAGFPTTYDKDDSPFVLIFRVGNAFHVRFAKANGLSRLPAASLPEGLLTRRKGIQSAPEPFLVAMKVAPQTLLETFEQGFDEIAPEDFDPKSIADGRQRIMAAVVRRLGQRAFRRKLLSAYETKCAVTRCTTLWVLEAAHITPYRGIKTNAVTNGLLLRADVHTLFDLALISIEPRNMTICVSSRLAGSRYSALNGQSPFLPANATAIPSPVALAEHFSLFQH